MKKTRYDISLWGETDTYLFKEGTHERLYEILGSKRVYRDDIDGVYFALWAPNAKSVSVVGDFNSYTAGLHPLKLRDDGTGVWEGFIESLSEGLTYKYHITGFDDSVRLKSDPYAFYNEKAPKSASIIYDIDTFVWNDEKWMQERHTKQTHKNAINIYEVHLGSWKRKVEEDNRALTYRELAQELAEYLLEMNYTHIEIMPITEYPFDGSWGYQVTGYFAPTARYGTPHEFMIFVDTMHNYGIGVIMDWVPSHFVTDGHGLYQFDGTALYEHQDPRKGFHPEWSSAIFNYGRNEVRAFLVSSAMFWFQKYHIDGIRVDGVASMLYLDYARKDGEWIANEFGGNENLEAITFLRQLNEAVYRENRGILMIAEESTAFPMVSRPTYLGGLGFGYKWNMGWMHDSLKYFQKDPIHRQHYHHHLTFSFVYMFNENYVLPLSHDEVVHLKGSLLSKMPGDDEKKFANLRALFAFMIAHPGKKLLFMGGEFGQWSEWDYKNSLDWHLLEDQRHQKLKSMVSYINALYKNEKSLYLYDCEPRGFEWIDELDYQSNVISFIRKSDNRDDDILVICHFADTTRRSYRIGVPENGAYKEIFNSQDKDFGGIVKKRDRIYQSEDIEVHGRANSIKLTLPPLSVIYLKKSI